MTEPLVPELEAGSPAGPAEAVDETGRRVAYLPAAALGNGSLLATISARGEVERLFWPHVDRGQHLGELRLGIASGGGVQWLDAAPFGWEQTCENDASILRTVACDGGLTVAIVDAVDVDEPVLARKLVADPDGGRLVVYCSPRLDEARYHVAGYVDPETGALVFYRRHVAMAVLVHGAVHASVVTRHDDEGHAIAADALDGRLLGDAIAHQAPVEGVKTIDLAGGVEVFVAFGSSAGEAVARARRTCEEGFDTLVERRRAHDAARLAMSARKVTHDAGVEQLRRRSLLVLELLTDRATGATIAAPELDPLFHRSGGYGFVWPRDLAYIVLGALAGGQDDLVPPALRWLARHQAPEGLWLQRYWTDGALAPSWGLHQIDETGAALFAYEAAWRELGDWELDRELWPSARAAADFLCRFTDPETGLPLPSVDLWEQHDGQHSYTAAAVFGGLAAAAELAGRHEPSLVDGYRAAAEAVRAGIEAHLWSEEHGRYVRSRWVGRSDLEGSPVPEIFERDLPYPNRVVRSAEPIDARLDSSLLGLAWPFRAVDPASPRMRATLDAIESELLLPDGGVLRHEEDDYAGGNPWLIATLWLGLHYRQVGDDAGWRRCLDYTIARQTSLGLLSEQVTRAGRPAWVLPLAWSHAMLLLASGDELAVVREGVGGLR